MSGRRRVGYRVSGWSVEPVLDWLRQSGSPVEPAALAERFGVSVRTAHRWLAGSTVSHLDLDRLCCLGLGFPPEVLYPDYLLDDVEAA